MTKQEVIYHLNSTGWLEERERIAIDFLDSIGCFEEHDRIMTKTADRPRSEQYKKGFEDAKRAFLVEYARESQNMRKRIAQLEIMLNAQKTISADRPRGKWIPCSEKMPNDGEWAIWCSSDGVIGIARFKEDCYNHFYPNETSFDLEDAVAWMPLPKPFYGIDMRGEDE